MTNKYDPILDAYREEDGGAYTLPTASDTVLGGIKVGNTLGIVAGVLNYTNPNPTPYTLPTAAAATLGGIKVGTRLSIDGSGVLSADVQSGAGDVVGPATHAASYIPQWNATPNSKTLVEGVAMPTGGLAGLTALGLKLDTTAFSDAGVTGKLITGFTSGAGAVAGTDTILQAIQKLDGNIGTKGAGTVTSVAALTLGTTGTDLSSSVATGTTTPVITLQVPTASASNRGVLSAADWSTFNGKQAALGFTAEDVANKSTNVTTDGASDTKYPSVKSIKDYADQLIGAANAVVYKGAVDCSTNPNYPAADAGWIYIVSVAGKIGGASGIAVEVGDMYICNTDGTAAGDQATVGTYWNVIQKNIADYVIGPASVTDATIPLFDGVTGKLLKGSAYTPASFDVAGAAAAVTPTTLGLVIGTNVQAYNSNLTAINQALTTTSSPSFTAVTAALTGIASGNALPGQTFYIGTTQVAINRASAALTLAGITLTTPDIGTPSAGVLTNATGLPAASVVAGILGVTGTRMTKLWATDIESTNAPTVGGVVVPTISSTSTLTNKTIGAGALTMAEDSSISLDRAALADGQYVGTTIEGVAGAALAFGDIIYLAVADSRWELADATAAATGVGMIGICVLAAAGDASATRILLQGFINAATVFPALTVGAPVYLDDVAGDVSVTIPTGADTVIRVLGFAMTADEMYWNPSSDHQISVA